MAECSLLFFDGMWQVGGVDKVTCLLAEEFLRRDWQVTIAVTRVDPERESPSVPAGVKFEVVPWGLNFILRVRALRRLLKARGVDVVINQWALPFSVSLTLHLAAAGLRIPIIGVQHNAVQLNNRILSARHGVSRAFWRFVTRWNLRLGTLLDASRLVLSEGAARQFREFVGAWSAKKLTVIPNPIQPVGCREGAKENHLIYVGRLSRMEKRVDRVLSVWREICGELSDWSLDLVGDGPDRRELEELSADLPRVTFQGFADPAPFYKRAKALLLTSEYEGFGVVLVEAMSAGCVPVVLDTFPSAREIVSSGEDGCVVPMPFDARKMGRAVLALVRDEEKRRRMAEAAMTAAKRYEVRTIVDQYETLLRRSLV